MGSGSREPVEDLSQQSSLRRARLLGVPVLPTLLIALALLGAAVAATAGYLGTRSSPLGVPSQASIPSGLEVSPQPTDSVRFDGGENGPPSPTPRPNRPKGSGSATSRQRIAIYPANAGEYPIHIIRPDGKLIRKLAIDASVYGITWSPDDSRLALSLYLDESENSEIFLIDADGKNLTQLTSNPGFDMSPTWSPDGRQIAFSSERDGKAGLYLMNADGSSQRELEINGLVPENFGVRWGGYQPAWSPDGKLIAVTGYRINEDPITSLKYKYYSSREIFLVDAGSGVWTQLTHDGTQDRAANNREPVWSPDGRSIVYSGSTGPYGQQSLFEIPMDGSSGRRAITSNTGYGSPDDTFPSWSPDGRYLVFERAPMGPMGRCCQAQSIWLVGLDGTDAHQVTLGGLYPAWGHRM